MFSSISLNNAEQLVGAFRVLQLNVSPFSLNKAADTLPVSAARDPGELPDSAGFVCLDDFIIVVGVASPKYTAYVHWTCGDGTKVKRGPPRPHIKLPVECITSVAGPQVDQDEMQRFLHSWFHVESSCCEKYWNGIWCRLQWIFKFSDVEMPVSVVWGIFIPLNGSQQKQVFGVCNWDIVCSRSSLCWRIIYLLL